MGSFERNMTSYFRNAVASQKTQQIEMKSDAVKVPISVLKGGKVPEEMCRYLLAQSPSENDDLEVESVEKAAKSQRIIIVANVVNIKSEGGVKHESAISDLTGVLFVPANLSETGDLTPQPDSLPWIPREYLVPVMDDSLVVGKVQDVDSYIVSKTKEIADIKNAGCWGNYIAFVEGLWSVTNNTGLGGEFIYNYSHGKQAVVLDSFAYIMPDTTILATQHIQKLYEYALTEDRTYNELYRKIIRISPQPERKLIENALPQMMAHMGQMNGAYPLSPTQREVINHFTASEEGEIIAVNGPPGTGKTTLLQSIVADMMVKRALNKEDAPIIVATSTNNQAVTNIIESFAATSRGTHPKKLDMHWVCGKESFATYFPSKSKIEEARGKGFQITDNRMGDTIAQWEKTENKQASVDHVLAHCHNLFEEHVKSIEQCRDLLHEMLCSFDNRRQRMLKLAQKIPFEIRVLSDDIRQNMCDMEDKIASCHQREFEYKQRLNEWEHLWQKLLFYRILKFIPSVKRRLDLKMSNFKTLDEKFPEQHFSMEDIEEYYRIRLDENKATYNGYKVAKELLEIALLFETVDVNVFASAAKTVSLTTTSLNTLFDANIRFFEFWLSVHYYECRWLAGEYSVDDSELFKSTYPVMTAKYKRLCMLTPCLVMTFFMLPANFSEYKDKYLYSFIDLLIVDEAGQVSPEIGAASFLLAKKALIVGDVNQIEPVWNVSRQLDMALAISNDVVPQDSFRLLECSGHNMSESNLMKIAVNACNFSKFGKKGLLLTEHRRCYDELISYCNELVYDGKLEPLRGRSTLDVAYPFVGQSAILHVQVSTTKSERRGTSRYNLLEAQELRKWLVENFDNIKRAYANEPEGTLVGIITPFKAQEDQIKKEIKGFEQTIDVGTVHKFQGGERRIILFSTVYGSEDGCSFLDYKPNLMNVAMSRAKDRFIVFGEINCLSQSKQKPSGLLRSYIQKA